MLKPVEWIRGEQQNGKGGRVVKAIAKKAKEGMAKKARGLEESVLYAIGHKIRVHVLIVLNEGTYTATEISERIDVPLNILYNHLRRLLDDGSIEIAHKEPKGNMMVYWYRAVEIQEYTVEEFEALPQVYRQNIVGAILQSGMAEVLAGLYHGKLADPRATVYWDWYNLDARGRRDADALTEKYVEDLREIECEATNRVAVSNESTVSMLLDVLFFERARKGSPRHGGKGKVTNRKL